MYTYEVIISRAPLRISLAGGGSDLPAFYREEAGRVLSFSINKYVYIVAHELFQGGIRLSYSQTEYVNNPTEIQHPIIRETFLENGFRGAIEIGSFADVPGTGTGLGSSSAFCVALLNALIKINPENEHLTNSSKFLAETACKIEINRCKQQIGKQDQFASAYGGLNIIEFFPNEAVEVSEISNQKSLKPFLNSSLLLFYLGFGRPSSELLKAQSNQIARKKSEFNAIRTIQEIVPAMEESIRNLDSRAVGELLTQSWKLKSSTSKNISSPLIERALKSAINLGAYGGKVIGAGGGGFILLSVDPNHRNEFIKAFPFRQLPFEISDTGAEIIHHSN